MSTIGRGESWDKRAQIRELCYEMGLDSSYNQDLESLKTMRESFGDPFIYIDILDGDLDGNGKCFFVHEDKCYVIIKHDSQLSVSESDDDGMLIGDILWEHNNLSIIQGIKLFISKEKEM
jgi:hypothetical protein